MKKKLVSTCILFAVILMPELKAQSPHINWKFDTKDASFGQSAAGDIDGDGKLEIVFGCYRNDSCIYALNAEDGSMAWKYNTHTSAEGCNDVAPIIYDVDGDGKPEVIVPSSCNPKTFCFNGNGSIKWVVNTRGSDSPPSIADIDNDGKPEILHGEFGGYVLCINAESGTIAWELAVDLNSWIQTAPTILDVNKDGQLDFVVGTWNNVNKADNKVYAFKGNDKSLLWSYPIGDFMYHGSAVADLDHDSKPELVIGSYNDTLYCLNAENGSINWKYSRGPSFYMGAPAAIADLDNNGWCEVVFSTWYVVGALSHDGKLLWQYSIPNYEQAFRGVALADINLDNALDIVFGTDGGNVIALNGKTGSLLWKKDLAAEYGNSLFAFDNAPLVADFNKDDSLDVFIVGGHAEYPAFQNNFGRAYMITAGKGNGPDWLMFQKDIRRRSSFCEDVELNISEFNLGGNNIQYFPNPFSEKTSLHSEINLENATLMVYNSLGIQVEEIRNINGFDFTFYRGSLAQGLYFFCLYENNINRYSFKMVVKD